ncbi:group II intron reverse transcriptase/maturase, partial [Nesterenkonia sp. MY13]|nr:group II intron reverse transcriptase/maturase [Nesterenkonia sedimenti]
MTPVNTGVLGSEAVDAAWSRVLRMQDKLHRWAQADPAGVFDDLFNLVYDPSFMLAAWDRVRGNKGGRTPGVDGIAPRSLLGDQAMVMLSDLRQQVKTRQYVPQPVREHKI